MGDANRKANERANRLLKNIREETGTEIKGIGSEEDYSDVINRCCENLIGYKKVPLGVSNRGVLINGRMFFIPIATTEGALVASMCRGIKLINACGGVKGYAENVGITRGFIMRFESFEEAMRFYQWIKMDEAVEDLKRIGNEGSRYMKISKIESKHVVGEDVYVKVYGYSGDAMGMNMITKACTQISAEISRRFPHSSLVCISSNTCTDKKWSAENYCNGRGRRIFMNMKIDDKSCREILGVGIRQVLDVYHAKVVIGGSLVLGGFNCQAANYVAGMFLALGQDLGQVIESSNCVLSMKRSTNGDLSVSLFMPSVVVGVIGGGTHLEPSKSFLKQFYSGSGEYIITNRDDDKSLAPGYLGLAVGAAVLGGELSLLGSLANNTLMESHLRLNREECRGG